MFLISAEEFSLCDKYMRYARNKDRGIKIIEPEEGNPLKIVYGMMLVNPIFDTTEAFKIADNVKNYSLFDISENNVNVSAYEDAKDVTVVLLEGKVGVYAQKISHIMKPGDKIEYNKATHKITATQVHPNDYIEWTKGNMYFEKESYRMR